jgi:hypothetical protein
LTDAAALEGVSFHFHDHGRGLVTLTGTRERLTALVAAQWCARLTFTADGYDVVPLED